MIKLFRKIYKCFKYIKKLRAFTKNIAIYYIRQFQASTSNSVKHIDLHKYNVILFIRGAKTHAIFKLSDLIFEDLIISSLTSEEAATIGFCYGRNFEKMNLRNNKKIFQYCISNMKKTRYSIISIDRRKNIIFSSTEKNDSSPKTMSPSQIIRIKKLINKFHPIQACYIGILAGANEKIINE